MEIMRRGVKLTNGMLEQLFCAIVQGWALMRRKENFFYVVAIIARVCDVL